jgi:hypothetical protein
VLEFQATFFVFKAGDSVQEKNMLKSDMLLLVTFTVANQSILL